MRDLNVFCPVGRAAMMQLVCALAGMDADVDVTESPQFADDGVFYVARNIPIPVLPVVSFYEAVHGHGR